MRPWLVAGAVVLAYALWRAWAPRPAFSAPDPASDDSTSSTSAMDLLQGFSNVFGSALIAGGFDDAAGSGGSGGGDDDGSADAGSDDGIDAGGEDAFA